MKSDISITVVRKHNYNYMKHSLVLQHILLRHWKDPLYKNSFFLLLSYLTGAGFGFIFWLLAAKFYPKEDVGIAAALISSISLIVLISGFGLDQSIIRFFPERDKNKVFSTSVIISTVFSVLLGIIFIVGSDLWLTEQGILKSSIAVLYLFFLAVYSFVGLTGTSFIAMRKAEFNFLQNVISGSRVFFLFPLIFLGAMGIFGAVGASFILTFIMSVVLLVKSGIKFFFTLDRTFLRDALNFSAGSYLAGLLITAPAGKLARRDRLCQCRFTRPLSARGQRCHRIFSMRSAADDGQCRTSSDRSRSGSQPGLFRTFQSRLKESPMLHIKARDSGTITAALLVFIALALAVLRTGAISPGEWLAIPADWSEALGDVYRTGKWPMNNLLIWTGILICLSQSAALSGLNLAVFSLSRLRLETASEKGDRNARRVLSLRQNS